MTGKEIVKESQNVNANRERNQVKNNDINTLTSEIQDVINKNTLRIANQDKMHACKGLSGMPQIYTNIYKYTKKFMYHFQKYQDQKDSEEHCMQIRFQLPKQPSV